MAKCVFCKKPLPNVVDVMCPHCFAAWTPDEPEDGKTVREKEDKEKK